MPRLLIVDPEDGPSMRAIVIEHGFDASIAQTVEEALVGLEQIEPHLVLIDHAATQDGMVLFSKLNGLPTIVCSRADSVSDRVSCLRMGADDFLSKHNLDPYLLAERINTVLRRATPKNPPKPALVQVGDLRIDLLKHRVTVLDRPVHLTPIEFQVLVVLATTDSVMTYAEISKSIWGLTEGLYHSIQVHTARLRGKLADAGLTNPKLVTDRSRGYRLELKGEP